VRHEYAVEANGAGMISVGHIQTMLAFLCTLAVATQAWSSNVFPWPDGRGAAIALTYDDAKSSQLDVAIPQLDAAGLKGTFFLTADNMSQQDVSRWRAVAAEGHELGNHSLFHPCAGGASKLLPQYKNEDYSIKSMLNEIRVMNVFLFAIDGQSLHSYAAPCGQTRVGGEDYSEALRESGLVRSMRVGGQGIFDPRSVDLFHVPSKGFHDVTGADLIAFVEQVRRTGGAGVMKFHGVGGNYLVTSAEAHKTLVDYLVEHQRDIWIAPFGELMDYVAVHRDHVGR